MKKESYEKFSYSTSMILGIVLALIAVGAMFDTEDVDDFFSMNDTKITQAMELRGDWLGMRITALNSPTALQWGIPPTTKGVMVVDIAERTGWRAIQAGLMEGDIIAAVDGKNILDLADLYDITRNLDVGASVILDVQRWGQPMKVVLPALYVAPPVANQPPVAQVANAGALQPVNMITGAQRGLRFHCLKHNRTWPQSAISPRYFCPLCNGPLNISGQLPFTRVNMINGAQQLKFYCPKDNRTWSQNMISPQYLCPLGNGPLSMSGPLTVE